MYFVLQWVGSCSNPSQLWFKNLLVIATCCQISYHNCLLEAKKKTKHLYKYIKLILVLLRCLGKSHYGPLQLQNFAPNLYFYSCNIATYNPLIFSPNSVKKALLLTIPCHLCYKLKNIKETLLTHKTKIGTAKTWKTNHYDWRIRNME